MPPKREAEAPLPGDGVFDGDYSDEKRRQVARSDAARLRGSYRYNTGGTSPRRDLPLFDRLRAERSQEICRRRAAQRAEWSSSSAAPATPPRKVCLGTLASVSLPFWCQMPKGEKSSRIYFHGSCMGWGAQHMLLSFIWLCFSSICYLCQLNYFLLYV